MCSSDQGCVVGARLTVAWSPLMFTFALVAVGCAVGVSSRVAWVALAIAAALGGAAASVRAHDGVRHSPLATGIGARALVVLDGAAVDDADPGRFSAGVLVRVACGRGAHRTVLVRGSGADAMRLGEVRAGDRVRVEGRLAPLRGSVDRRARLRHAVARLERARLLAEGRDEIPPAMLRALGY